MATMVAAPSSPTCRPWPVLEDKGNGPLFERMTSPTSTAVPGSPHFLRAFSEESFAGLDLSILEAPTLSLDLLEGRLAEVKALYKERFGEDFDAESEEQVTRDEDGTPYVVTVDGSVQPQPAAPETRLDALAAALAEVKQLYQQKFGDDVDAESEEETAACDEAGTPYIVTVGTGVQLESFARETRLDALVATLADVKQLYQQKFGEDVDADFGEEREIRDEDGTPYILTVGVGVQPQSDVCEARMDALSASLAEVKQLYRQRFGEDIDVESEEETVARDQDGTPYKLTVGLGVQPQPDSDETRLDSLTASLAEVKQLYKLKFGVDVDAAVDEGREMRRDEDGTPYVFVSGIGVELQPDVVEARFDVLTASLAEVKQLYRQKFGQDVDADSEEQVVHDQDGTPYIAMTVGRQHETRLDALTASLAEVQQLFLEKFGEDVDADSEEEKETRDEDGALWISTSGVDAQRQSGACETRLDALTASLAEVKRLYKQKYGQDIDADSEEEQEACSYETRLDALTASLEEIKLLYKQQFGEDIDAEPEEEQVSRDEDGTPYVVTVGAGVWPQSDACATRLDALTAAVAEVKQLYQQKFGEDVDADFEEEHEIRDADGTPYTVTVGAGVQPPSDACETRLDALAATLAEVKQLYWQKFGEDVDADSGEEQAVRDGAPPYTLISAAGVKRPQDSEARVDVLMASLAEAKALYRHVYGQDVDTDSDDEQDQGFIDADGTTWVRTVGRGLRQ